MMWGFALFFLFILFAKAYRNTFDLQISCVPVAMKASERIRTDQWLPLRILHLSDLHMENLSVKASAIVDHLKGEPLDLIAITGDLLDRAKNIPAAVQYVAALQQLNPQLGTYIVFGNHDYVLPPHNLAQLKTELERIGCRVLRNQTHTLDVHGQKLHIIGIDDYATRRSDLEKSYRSVTDEGLRLVLTHDPNIVLRMKDYEYDYLLAGHFHGGQIHWPKPYHLIKMGKLPRMNIVKGLHYREGRPFYISEGLGQTGLNFRLRSRPEITVHILQPQPLPEHQAVRLEQAKAQPEAAPTWALE
ncbi:metallophosphoesterase [Brevibacillus sp. SYP-B805]|uniref:metallophosphoesterase n=1 Tax=Brevibacillus sp. SYP-B805 TaxID=1578199 RepID=UPI0013EB8E2D|nr:metallophosphoesterase [Brevibacillus sp. SYP-B805]NGQ97095.1 metallophosphoesterase [Brevibacillus sp. SYP-B805]